MDATAFVTTTLRHVQSRCAQLYSAHPGAAESDSLLCSQAPGTLPEVDVKRVSNELYCKPVLGITPNTNVLHVHIDGNIHAAFKQMTIQDHYAELYLPHLRGSYTASTEEQVRRLLLRLQSGMWMVQAIEESRIKGYTAELLLQAQSNAMREAEIGIVHAPKYRHILQTYAVVRAYLSDGLEFPGLLELLKEVQPEQPDSIIIGFVGELANYGSLGATLRWLDFQHEELEGADASARGAAVVLKLLAALHTAKGVAALHAHGTVHGDIKAHNIMASASPAGICYKVGDLGSGAVMDATSGTVYMGSIHGTMGHISPEVIQEYYDHGCVHYTPADDVHSMGMVLAQLAAGCSEVMVDDELGVCWDTVQAPAGEAACGSGTQGGATEAPPAFDEYCRLMRADPTRIRRSVQARLAHLLEEQTDAFEQDKQRQQQQQQEEATATTPMSAAAAALAAKCEERERGLAAIAMSCLDTRAERPTAAQVVEQLELLLGGMDDGWPQLMAVLPAGFELPPYEEPPRRMAIGEVRVEEQEEEEEEHCVEGEGCDNSSRSGSSSDGVYSDSSNSSLGSPRSRWFKGSAAAGSGRGWSLLDMCTRMVARCGPLLERAALLAGAGM